MKESQIIRAGLRVAALAVILLPAMVSSQDDDAYRRIESRADLIREVQIELQNRGYYVTATDGLVGKDTRAAVEAFQRDAGMVVDGEVNRELLAQLERRAFVGQPYFSMAAGRSPSLVGNVQVSLSRAGYYRGPVDGILNPATRQAIKLYRTVPYEQVFVDGYPRNYTWLSPVTVSLSIPKPLFRFTGLDLLTEKPGMQALQADDFAGAISEASTAIRAVQGENATSVCAYFVRGVAHLRLGDYDAAIRDFTSVLRISPTMAEAYFNRSVAYQHAGLPEFARRDYRQAIDLQPALGTAEAAPRLAHTP